MPLTVDEYKVLFKVEKPQELALLASREHIMHMIARLTKEGLVSGSKGRFSLTRKGIRERDNPSLSIQELFFRHGPLSAKGLSDVSGIPLETMERMAQDAQNNGLITRLDHYFLAEWIHPLALALKYMLEYDVSVKDTAMHSQSAGVSAGMFLAVAVKASLGIKPFNPHHLCKERRPLAKANRPSQNTGETPA